MKFLVSARPGPMPPPVDLIRAAQEWLDGKLADGTFEVVYAYPSGGGFSISDHDSHDELMEQLLEYPLSPFVEFEVTPLVEMGAAFDRMIPFAERMSAQMAGAATE